MKVVSVQAVKPYGGVKVQLHSFLTSALRQASVSALGPGRFKSGEKAPGTYWEAGWALE
jgi:hypothetical protein